MQFGAIAHVAPVLLVVGGIAAPLAFAELFVWSDGGDVMAGDRAISRNVATEAGPTFVPAAASGDCAAAEAGIVPLGRAIAIDDQPYAVAEGEAPDQTINLLHQAPVILGSRLRVEAPVALGTGCVPDPAYQPAQPVDDAVNT